MLVLRENASSAAIANGILISWLRKRQAQNIIVHDQQALSRNSEVLSTQSLLLASVCECVCVFADKNYIQHRRTRTRGPGREPMVHLLPLYDFHMYIILPCRASAANVFTSVALALGVPRRAVILHETGFFEQFKADLAAEAGTRPLITYRATFQFST